MSDTLLDISIYVTYGLIAIAAVAAIIFPLFHLVQDFRKAKGALLGVLALVVVLAISYFLASNEPYPANNVGPITSQVIGGGIIATMILVVVGFLAAIFTEIFKLFR